MRRHSLLVLFAALAGAACGPTPEGGPEAANLAPFARFSAPAQVALGEAVAFDGSASFDPDGTILAYRFLFADATPEVVTGDPRVTHVFELAGAFQVQLEVRDDRGASHLARHRIEVTAGAPPACDEAAPCPRAQPCRDGRCWNEGPGDACAGPGDCEGEDVGCYGGVCTTPECHQDATCGEDAACRGGLCQRLEEVG